MPGQLVNAGVSRSPPSAKKQLTGQFAFASDPPRQVCYTAYRKLTVLYLVDIARRPERTRQKGFTEQTDDSATNGNNNQSHHRLRTAGNG